MSIKLRGFGTLKARDPQRLRHICSAGGKAAHAVGTAHEFTHDEALAAGAIGGRKTAARPGHMANIGKLGGQMSALKRRQQEHTPNELAE